MEPQPGVLRRRGRGRRPAVRALARLPRVREHRRSRRGRPSHRYGNPAAAAVQPPALEATLVYYARFYPPWLLALVGTAGASLAEAVNYRLVDWAAELPKLAALRTGKAARWSVAAFLRAPFWTTVLVIFSPIPDSAVRVLAPLGKYPLPRYLGAVALGRYPRLLLVASSGALLRIPLPLLVLASVGIVLAGLGWRRLQRAGLTEP